MFLPHGYEGQGPEHSSARLERFLQLCAEDNMQVCNLTTPGQMFHVLRRQIHRKWRKPLIIMTPKSLLRTRASFTPREELIEGSFQRLIGDDSAKPKAVRRVMLCSGKVYYELLERRREQAATNVAIIRLEQLYPFPEADLAKAIAPFSQAKEVVWCQEEPMNQGAWYASQHHMRRVILDHKDGLYLAYAGRPPFAAPAGGYAGTHNERQSQLVEDALFN